MKPMRRKYGPRNAQIKARKGGLHFRIMASLGNYVNDTSPSPSRTFLYNQQSITNNLASRHKPASRTPTSRPKIRRDLTSSQACIGFD